MTTTIVPIVHPERRRRGVILRRAGRLAEASPLPGRSRERYEDVLEALVRGDDSLPSLDFARWALDASFGVMPIRSQLLLDDPATAVARARAARASAFKLKLRRASDADVLLALRAELPDATLRVDANRAFTSASEVPWDALARAAVAWIEEPCPEAGRLAHAPVPVALDESVEEDPDRALADVAEGRAVALVLKPTVLGAETTLRIGRACRALGGRVVVSHAFESDVGRRAAEELARRIEPGEVHGLARWDGIDGYRIAIGGAPLRSLAEGEDRADPALG